MNNLYKNNCRTLLFLTFVIVSTLSIILINYTNYLNTENKISQGFYSNNTVFFRTDYKKMTTTYEALVSKGEDCILFREFGLNYDIRGIYYKGNIEQPKLREGRFLKATDFYNNRKVAVVGQGIMQDDNDRTINLFGNEYEVIGILGVERPSLYDQMIFFNIDSIDLDNIEEGLWAIDGNSNTEIMSNFDIVKDHIRSNGGNVDILEVKQHGVVDMLKYNIVNIGILTIIVVLFSLSSIYVSQLWFDHKKQEFAVVKLVGYESSKKVIFNIIKEFISIATAGASGSILFILILNILGISQIKIDASVIISGMIIIVFCSSMVIPPAISFYNLEVRELLLGEN